MFEASTDATIIIVLLFRYLLLIPSHSRTHKALTSYVEKGYIGCCLQLEEAPYLLSVARASLINLTIGVLFLVFSLVLAFSSFSVVNPGFGRFFFRFDPYFELLSIVFMAVGAFFMFRAGQEMPRRLAARKSLADQVKSVEESQ